MPGPLVGLLLAGGLVAGVQGRAGALPARAPAEDAEPRSFGHLAFPHNFTFASEGDDMLEIENANTAAVKSAGELVRSRRQAGQELSYRCSMHGYIEPGTNQCQCVDDYAGAHCQNPCNGAGFINSEGECTCNAGYTTVADGFASSYGALQCNYITCDINRRRQDIPVDQFGRQVGAPTQCGLGPRQQYPRPKRDSLGSLRNPVTASERGDSLSIYPTDDDRVFFRDNNFRYMTRYTLAALQQLAARVSDPVTLGRFDQDWPCAEGGYNADGFCTAGETPVIYVTNGWTELPDDTASMTRAQNESLTYEGREIEFILVRRSLAENAEAVATCLNNYQGLQQRNPLCGFSTGRDDNAILHNDHLLRMTAQMAWESGFDWVQHNTNDYGGTHSTRGISAGVVVHGCGGRLDLAFLLDGSGSVDDSGWNHQLDFVKAMAGRFPISETGTHISVSTVAGPRTAHFTANMTHVDQLSTFRRCETNADCHDITTIEHEECHQGTCQRITPRHCRNGEFTGNVTYPDGRVEEACICQQNRQCTPGSPRYEGPGICLPGSFTCDNGCNHADLASVVGGCGDFNPATGRYDIGESCEADRWFYNPGCESCRCEVNEGEGDYMWDLSHSAWTDADFNSFSDVTELQNAIDAGKSNDCPAIDSTAFDTKPAFCYPDGATHLKYGLLHVLDDVFVLNRGMRPFTEGIPRVLITLSDGKANPHFEADEWAREIKSQGIRMFSIGMEDTPGDRNYQQQLEVLASNPVDRHMFELDGTDHLQDIVDALSWDVCEISEVIPPGIIINATVDAGATEYFEWPCSVNSQDVTVVVDSPDGNTKVVVATAPNPSLYDEHISFDTSNERHKVLQHENQGRTVYAAVQSSSAAAASFTISLYIGGIFAESATNPTWPEQTPTVGTTLYTPVMSSTTSGPFEFSLQTHGDSANYFTLLDVSTGAVGLTTEGRTAFESAATAGGRSEASFQFELYVNGTGDNSSCANGYQEVTFGRTAPEPPGWEDEIAIRTVDTLREYVGSCDPNPMNDCPWPRDSSLTTTMAGAVVTSLTVDRVFEDDRVEFNIDSGNTGDAFELRPTPARRRRRNVQGINVVTDGSASMDVVVRNSESLSTSSTWTLNISSRVIVGSEVENLPPFQLTIGPLVPSRMTPHFALTTNTVTAAPGESFAVTVINPDDIAFTCVIDGDAPSSFNAERNNDENQCLVSIAASATAANVPLSLQLVVDGVNAWPSPFGINVNIVPTLTSTTESPTAPTTLTDSSTGPTIVINLDGGLVAIEPTEDAQQSTGSEDDSSMGGGTIAALVIGILLCLLLAVLLGVWVFKREEEMPSELQRESIKNPTYAAAGAPQPTNHSGLPRLPATDTYDTVDINAVSNPMYGAEHGGGDIIASQLYGGDTYGQATGDNGGYLDISSDNRSHGGALTNQVYQATGAISSPKTYEGLMATGESSSDPSSLYEMSR